MTRVTTDSHATGSTSTVCESSEASSSVLRLRLVDYSQVEADVIHQEMLKTGWGAEELIAKHENALGRCLNALKTDPEIEKQAQLNSGYKKTVGLIIGAAASVVVVPAAIGIGTPLVAFGAAGVVGAWFYYLKNTLFTTMNSEEAKLQKYMMEYFALSRKLREVIDKNYEIEVLAKAMKEQAGEIRETTDSSESIIHDTKLLSSEVNHKSKLLCSKISQHQEKLDRVKHKVDKLNSSIDECKVIAEKLKPNKQDEQLKKSVQSQMEELRAFLNSSKEQA